MDPIAAFAEERRRHLEAYARDAEFRQLSQRWLEASMRKKYVYNFDWLGRPIIQYPQDMWAVQELVWQVKPDLIVETGIAHGGSLILSASMLAMLDYCDAMAAGTTLDPRASRRKVIGIDIDIVWPRRNLFRRPRGIASKSESDREVFVVQYLSSASTPAIFATRKF